MSRYLHGILILLLLSAILACGEGVTSGDPLSTDSITVKAEPESGIYAGQDSRITATVVRPNKQPPTDRLVTFRIITNNSGGSFRFANDRVDGQGNALAVYTAGWNSPADDVWDTIQATLSNGAAATAAIKRIKSAAAFSITVKTESLTFPPTLSHPAGNMTVTANVKNNFGNAASGVMVAFTVTGSVRGSVSPATAITDGSGNATTVYTGIGGTVPPGSTDAVTASITVEGVTYSASTIIAYP